MSQQTTGLSYLVENLPYGFCPGCSHGQVVDALGETLARMSPEREHVVIVSDIGCVGLSDKHFDLSTFHGLHGRSVTYGAGLKLARPELKVFVLIGDGGTGIGGHHLINAARRNVDLTVVVFNNFNYGMTGGEHSATTPFGAFTSSTPTGNDERPIDLCALMSAAGAGFVARLPAFDKNLPAAIQQASDYRGFALVDVWEICTAYYMPRNTFKKKELLALSEAANMPFGVLKNEPPRSHMPVVKPPPKPVGLSQDFRAELSKPLRLLIAGAAGQKVKTTATMLGRAAIRAGLYATQKDDYPITVKTGHSVAELILSPTPIRFTGITCPDIAVVTAPEGLGRCKASLAGMPKGTRIYSDPSFGPIDSAAELVPIDVDRAAKSVGRENVSLWAAGRIVRDLQGFPGRALLDTIEKLTPAKYRDEAVKAVTGD